MDLSGDGRDDLLTLSVTGKTRLRLSVAVSDGADYGPLTTWFAGDVGRPVAGAQLVAGDFNADGRNDAAVLLQDPPPASDPGSPPPPPTATLLLFRTRAVQTSFAGPITWWNGPLDMSVSRAWGADLNGDGRADLLVQQDLGTAGVRFASALAPPITGPLMALATRLDIPDLSAVKLRTTMGDVNRDGRDDVFLVFPFNGGTRVDGLRAKPTGALQRFTLWTSAGTDNLPFAKLKVESTDVNFDGLADLVLLRNDGRNGTSLVTLRSNYVNLTRLGSLTDPTLDWTTAAPY